MTCIQTMLFIASAWSIFSAVGFTFRSRGRIWKRVCGIVNKACSNRDRRTQGPGSRSGKQTGGLMVVMTRRIFQKRGSRMTRGRGLNTGRDRDGPGPGTGPGPARTRRERDGRTRTRARDGIAGPNPPKRAEWGNRKPGVGKL